MLFLYQQAPQDFFILKSLLELDSGVHLIVTVRGVSAVVFIRSMSLPPHDLFSFGFYILKV